MNGSDAKARTAVCTDTARSSAVARRIDTPTHQAILYAEAGRALGRLNARSPEAVALLEKMLAHRDEEVRGAAAEALGRVGGKAHADLLTRAAASEPFGWVKRHMLESADRLNR